MTEKDEEVTREDVPPACNLCKRTKYQRVASHLVPGQGAVLVSYWLCKVCDAPDTPRTKS